MATSCGVLWKKKYAMLTPTSNTTNPITNTALPHENLLRNCIGCSLCVGGRDTGEEADVLGGIDIDDEDGGGVTGMVEGGKPRLGLDRDVLSSTLLGWARSSSARL